MPAAYKKFLQLQLGSPTENKKRKLGTLCGRTECSMKWLLGGQRRLEIEM